MKSAGFVYTYLCVYTNIIVVGEVFTLGYLTGSQRRSGNLEYAKPGTFGHCYTIRPSTHMCANIAYMHPPKHIPKIKHRETDNFH